MRKNNKQSPIRSTIDYFERIIKGHNKVEEIKAIDKDIYEIRRLVGHSLKLLIADIYLMGEADVLEILSEHKNIDCIVLIGFYNRYTSKAKEMAKAQDIGLFNIRELLGAINYSGEKMINYEPKQ